MTRREFVALAAVARDESVARVAERELAPNEFILVRTSDGARIGERWKDPQLPAPLGSLVKPFVALAYGDSHGFRYPDFTCAGCWLPRGHGHIGITAALAHSCNSYFLQLAALVNPDDVTRTAEQFGLPAPSDASPDSLIGRYGKWRIAPLAMANAYNELVHRRSDPGVPLILDAMRRCARSGTASAIAAPVAAKTGTAPCVHPASAIGDGLLAALFPSETPGFVLLVRAHGVPGAECARRSGPFLRAVLG